MYSTSALLLLEGGDEQSYDSLLLVSQKSQKTDLNDLVAHTASHCPVLPGTSQMMTDIWSLLSSVATGCILAERKLESAQRERLQVAAKIKTSKVISYQ